MPRYVSHMLPNRSMPSLRYGFGSSWVTLRPVLVALIGAVLVACAPDAGGAAQGHAGQATNSGSASADRGSDQADPELLGFAMGREDAPVTVVEMSDYGCGYCGQFHLETFGAVREEFIATGKVRWRFVPFVSGLFRASPSATEAAECALEQGPAQFERMNARIWAEQRAWKRAENPAEVLRGFAETEGIDLVRYDTCVDEERRRPRVIAHTSYARDLGVRATPTFFIDGFQPIPGALPTQMFLDLLARAYVEATR